MKCPGRELELNALVDGETGHYPESELLLHIAACPHCAAEVAGLLALRSRLARLVPVEQPTPSLHKKILDALRPYHVPVVNNVLKIVGYSVSALAIAATVVLLMLPRNERATTLAVADAASRQTIANTAVILADSRPGGADAWFARQNLATPPAPDLTSSGFMFIGCRTDIVAGHRASILVYRRDHVQISLVVWPTTHEPRHKPVSTTINGDSLQYWNNGTLEFWATGNDAAAVKDFTAVYRRSA